MGGDSHLRERVVEIASDYLGPAAPRFIDRIITNHLQILPADLKQKDMPELIEWTKLATAMLTDSMAEVEEFTSRLQAVSLTAKQ